MICNRRQSAKYRIDTSLIQRLHQIIKISSHIGESAAAHYIFSPEIDHHILAEIARVFDDSGGVSQLEGRSHQVELIHIGADAFSNRITKVTASGFKKVVVTDELDVVENSTFAVVVAL